MGKRKNRNTAEYYDKMERSSFLQYGLGALKVILWTIIYVFLVSVPQMYTMFGGFLDETPAIIFGILSIIFMFAVSYWFYRRFKKKHPEQAVALTKEDIWKDILLYGGVMIFKIAMGQLMIVFYGEETTVNDEMIFGMLQGNGNIFLALSLGLSVITMAPVMEEIIFRGMISNEMFRNKSFWVALILSSLFFSSLHLSGNLISFLLYAGIGAACFMAFWRKKNINDAILLHFLNNLPGAVMIIFNLF